MPREEDLAPLILLGLSFLGKRKEEVAGVEIPAAKEVEITIPLTPPSPEQQTQKAMNQIEQAIQEVKQTLEAPVETIKQATETVMQAVENVIESVLKPTTTEQPVEQMVTEPVVQEQVVSAEDLIKEAEEVKQQITQQVVETPEKQMQEESVTIDGVTIICRPWEKKKYIVRVPCYQKHILRSFEEFQMAQRFAAKVAEMLGIPLRYLVIDLVPNYVPEPSWEMYEEMLRKIEDILATGSVELVCGLQPRVATATTETTPELAPPPGYFIA